MTPEIALAIGALLWFPSIMFSMLVLADKHYFNVGLGIALGALLGPIGFIVALLLPSRREEDRIQAEVERLRIQRRAQAIVDRESLPESMR